MIDTHAHIAMEGYDGGIAGVLARAAAAGVSHVICVGAGGDVAEAQSAVDAARQFAGVSAICGMHPHQAEEYDDALWAALSELCRAPEVVAVGETGYDFHYNHSTPAEQEQVFRLHVRLARALRKPLCVHTRNAEAETLRLLREERAWETGGVIHCFSGTLRFAQDAAEMGFCLSIPGIVTFRRPGELVDVVAGTALDRLLVETDAPFLAPMPHRGRRNEPMYLPETLKKIAEIRGISVQQAEAATTANAIRLFGPRLEAVIGVAPPAAAGPEESSPPTAAGT